MSTRAGADGPGDLDAGHEEGTMGLRVWVEQPQHAPAPAVVYRAPGGAHYYDHFAAPGEVEAIDPPDEFIHVAVFNPAEAETLHPFGCGPASEKAAERVEIDRIGDAPQDAVVECDPEGDTLYYTEQKGLDEADRRDAVDVIADEDEPTTNTLALPAMKAWNRYRGPLGGEGWRNIITGEVRYQDTHPTRSEQGMTSETGLPPQSESAARDAVRESTPEEVAEAAGAELGVEPERLIDASHTSTGEPDSWGVANAAVAVAATRMQREGEREGSEYVESLVDALAALGREIDEREQSESQREGISDEGVSDIVEEVAESYMAEAEPEPDTVEDLNNGFCVAIAGEIFERAGEPEGMQINGAAAGRWTHQWVSYDGKHYDAEVPEGVDEVEDLPIFQRIGTPHELWVVEEGGEEQEADAPESEKAWVPYVGPEGGTGWQHTGSGEVRYQEEAPGKTVDEDELRDAMEAAGFDEADVEAAVSEVAGAGADSGNGERGFRGPDTAGESGTDAVRAAFEGSWVKLDAEQSEKTIDTLEEAAARARSEELVEHTYGHVRTWEQEGGFGGNPDRASFNGSAKYGGYGEGRIRLGESGSGPDTINHESAHALVDSYGYDYQTTAGNKWSHDYSDWGREWDFGGRDPEKKEMMLASYGDLEDRVYHADWEDFEGAGESIDDIAEPGNIRTGDRIAIKQSDSPLYTSDAAWEGTVAATESTRVVSELDQLDAGDEVEVTLSTNEAVRLFGEDISYEDRRVSGVVRKGDDYPNPAHLELDGGETADFFAHEVDSVNGHGPTGLSIRNDGHTIPLTEPVLGDAEMVRTANADEREYINKSDYDRINHGAAVQGKAAQIEFGSGKTYEGVIDRETSGQFVMAWRDDDGEYQEKQFNKGTTYQQTVRIAQNDKSFDRGRPTAGEPPGYREAIYETMDIDERDVDWNTSVRYDDPDEFISNDFERGDLLLVKREGERKIFKPTDYFDAFIDEADHELQGSLAIGEEGNLGAGMGRSFQARTDQIEIVGHAPASDFVAESDTDKAVDVSDPSAWSEGDTITRVINGHEQKPKTIDSIERNERNEQPDFWTVVTDDGRGFTVTAEEAAEDSEIASVVRDTSDGLDYLSPTDRRGEKTDEEAVRDLVAAANKSWFGMATKRELDERPESIGSPYSETNPHETIAKTHEIMQSDSKRKTTSGVANLLSHQHRDLASAYLGVHEPSVQAKRAMNEYHEENGVSPFEDTPYPEAEPTVLSVQDALEEFGPADTLEDLRVAVGRTKEYDMESYSDLAAPGQTFTEDGESFEIQEVGEPYSSYAQVKNLETGDVDTRPLSTVTWKVPPPQAIDYSAAAAAEEPDEATGAASISPSSSAVDKAARYNENGRESLANAIENTLDRGDVPEPIRDHLATSPGALGFGWENDGETVDINSQSFDKRVAGGESYMFTFGGHLDRDQKTLNAVGRLVEAPEDEDDTGLAVIGGEEVEVAGYNLYKWLSDGAVREASGIVEDKR